MALVEFRKLLLNYNYESFIYVIAILYFKKVLAADTAQFFNKTQFQIYLIFSYLPQYEAKKHQQQQ